MKNYTYHSDLQRYASGGRSHATRFIFWFRLYQRANSAVLRCIAKLFLYYYRDYYGLDIGINTIIGAGLYLGHAWNITINPLSRIGCNCNIHKGVVIGQTNRGSRIGTPIIGNEVWIGINAVVVGGINIGDDVLIAPNSFVNCDIPSHSVVFGNPCVIKHRDNATENYINNKVELDYHETNSSLR